MKYLFLLFPLIIFSQVNISGEIKDEYGNSIMGANIIAINNSSQILDGFGISNENGYYSLNLKKNTDFNIKVSFIGYTPIELNLTLDSDLEKNFVLKQQAEALDAVELVYEMPVEIKGDTIVYSADAFNTGTEKKLSDVLANMPGIEVNDDGRIEVEGQEVKKIQIEGRDFFDGDTKLAAQNLPAKAVGKVEVLRNFSEVGQLRNLQNNEDNFAINIRLKEGKDKFWFGEILAGTGPEDIHLIAPKIFYYDKKFNFSVLGNSNDIGQPVLSRRDFYKFSGGFENLNRSTGTSINISSDFAGIGGLQNNRAKSIESNFGAVNFSVNNDKGLEISGFSVLTSSTNEIEEQISRTYNQTEVVENTSEFSLQKNSLEIYKFSLDYEPSDIFQIEYNILLNNSDQSELNDLTSIYGRQSNRVEEELNLTRKQTPFSLNQELKLYFTLNENHIFSFESQYLNQTEDPMANTIRDRNPFLSLISFDTNVEKYNFTQFRNIDTKKFESKFDYFFIVNNKSNLNLSIGLTNVNQMFNSSFSQVLSDYSIKEFNDDVFINEVDFNFRDFYIALKYRIKTGIFTIDPGLILHFYKNQNLQNNQDFNRSFSDIRPNLRINLRFKQNENLRLTYRKNTQFTDINNLSQGYIFNNYNSIFKGNSTLEAAIVNNYNLNYRSINQFTFTNVFVNANYSKRTNTIQSAAVIDGINAVRTAVNSTFPRETYSLRARIDKRFKNIKLNLSANLRFSDFYNTINNVVNKAEDLSRDFSTSIETNFRDKPNFELGIRYNVNDYKNGETENKFIRETPFAKIDAYFGDGFVFTAEYSYNKYRNGEQVINYFRFLDADLSYNKEGSKWEFSIGMTNLLNDQSTNRDSFNQFFTQTRSYIIQPRYILFKLKYDLTFIGGKSKKKSSNDSKKLRGNAGGGVLR